MRLGSILSCDLVEICSSDIPWLESIFSSSSFSEDGQISLRAVETIHPENLPRYRVLFDGISLPRSVCFNLNSLSIRNCDTVKNILPVQFLQNLPNLELLNVSHCKNVEDIIKEEAEMSKRGHHRDDINTISLPKLKQIALYRLPRLKIIYNGTMDCQSIDHVIVQSCPLVRRLPLSLPMDSEQARALPHLKYIAGQEEWWESLEWDDPCTRISLEPFFVPY